MTENANLECGGSTPLWIERQNLGKRRRPQSKAASSRSTPNLECGGSTPLGIERQIPTQRRRPTIQSCVQPQHSKFGVRWLDTALDRATDPHPETPPHIQSCVQPQHSKFG